MVTTAHQSPAPPSAPSHRPQKTQPSKGQENIHDAEKQESNQKEIEHGSRTRKEMLKKMSQKASCMTRYYLDNDSPRSQKTGKGRLLAEGTKGMARGNGGFSKSGTKEGGGNAHKRLFNKARDIRGFFFSSVQYHTTGIRSKQGKSRAKGATVGIIGLAIIR